MESFGSGRSAQGSKGGGRTLELKGPQHKVTFTKSGITVDCDEHVTLLELAEAHGIEIEYSCRVGSCGACEVKCKGDIKASEECAIDGKTKAAGFVYTCCSRSLGDLEIEA
jgi:glycine betaine catabolism B